MLFMGLLTITFALFLVAFDGNDPFFAFFAGINVGWGSLMVIIALVVRHAERKREQWWKRDD